MPNNKTKTSKVRNNSKVSKNLLIKQRLNEKMKPTSFMGKVQEESSFSFNKPLRENQSTSFLTDAT